jgi:hypothetical protein
MIKCGTIAAVVLAGSAAGTATLVSNPDGTEQLVSADRSPYQQAISVRGTRPALTTSTDAEYSIGHQPRRGERAEHPVSIVATAAVSGDLIRRGIR